MRLSVINLPSVVRTLWVSALVYGSIGEGGSGVDVWTELPQEALHKKLCHEGRLGDSVKKIAYLEIRGLSELLHVRGHEERVTLLRSRRRRDAINIL